MMTIARAPIRRIQWCLHQAKASLEDLRAKLEAHQSGLPHQSAAPKARNIPQLICTSSQVCCALLLTVDKAD